MFAFFKQRAGYLVLIMLSALALFITGSSSTSQVVGIDKSGSLTVEMSADKTTIGSILKKQMRDILPIGTATISKRDYLLYVDYKMKVIVDTNEAKLDESVLFKADLPGSVVSSNSDTVDNGKAIWNLTPNNYMEIQHSTRNVRWWLIILFVFSMGFISYAYLRTKE